MTISNALMDLNHSIPNIIGGALIRIEDGSIIAHVIQQKIDNDLVGCLTASMLGIGERISAELMYSEIDRLYVESPNGYVLVSPVGKENALIVLTNKKAKLGLIFFEINRTKKVIEQLLESNQAD